MRVEPEIPVLWTVKTFAQKIGVPEAEGFAILSLLPKEAVIRFGRRIRLNAEIVTDWVRRGGSGK